MERGGSSSSSSNKSSRPYHECPFCKHGFTTAQALGGHMNIHRRDRASRRRPGRDTPAAAASATLLAYPQATPPMGASFITYYDPGAASAAPDAASFGGGGAGSQQRELNLFAAAATGDHDLRLALGSRTPGEWGPSDGEAERSLVDLELRLGRHPGCQ